jgi:NTE family protein
MTLCEFPRRHLQRSAAHPEHDVSLKWIADDDDGPSNWADLKHIDWSTFRLVLGAGGATGAAFTAGVLLALATDHDIKLGNASHLVGTSAGSVIAALIAMGFDSEDLAAVVARNPHYLSLTVGPYQLAFGDEVPPIPKLRNMVRPMGARDVVRSASLAATRQYRALWLHCVRPGTFDLSQQLPFVPALEWPATGRVSVCCADNATGERVVYDRESGVDMADAISASCAVPGVIRPVTIGDRVLVDGGIASPTNADLALEDGDGSVTVVVSPMSGTGSHSALGRASSIFAAKRLLGEIRRSNPAGGVLLIEPAASLGALVIDNALDHATTNRILGAAFLGPAGAEITHRHIARPERLAETV